MPKPTAERWIATTDLIALLNDEQSRAINLAFDQQMHSSEVAATMGVSIQDAKRHIREAIATMREHLVASGGL